MVNSIQPDWSVAACVRGFFTTRLGGRSLAPYDSFNLGLHVGDEAEHVLANRAQLDVPGDPKWLNQTHSNRCLNLDVTPEGVDADASITRERGKTLAIMVADCLPIFLADRAGLVVAVVHAGWRGLANKIIPTSVAMMGSSDVVAWLGPAIGSCHYEVGEDVRCQFGDIGFSRAGDKWMMNLAEIATHQLYDAGVVDVTRSELCTYCDAHQFFSHRRDRVTGRMAGFLWLED